MANARVVEWINAKFIEWERAHSRKGTIREFSKWLGISEKTVSHWMVGRSTPAGDNVDILASKLGPEIYDLLGLARPDPILALVIKMYGSLPQGRRDKIVKLVQREYDEEIAEQKTDVVGRDVVHP